MIHTVISRSTMSVVIVIILLLCVSEPVAQQTPLAPLFDSLGDHHHAVTTSSEEAQQYFDQGLVWHYGFNHAEAIRSFRQAQRLDPDCAMAYWGEALSLGPHINAGMSRAAVELAWDAIQTAQQKSGGITEREKNYINALAERYSPDVSAKRGALNRAYADAMRELARNYPDDPDAQALFAEALMITTPWDYWLPDGSPNETGEEIVSVLESSMARQPDHPGTNHFYIHTVEPRHPERGSEAADRMRDLVPYAGHLQHMPSHIYIQTGRYADASLANEKAVRVDSIYLERHGAHGMYRISYMPHNAIYLCHTTALEGRGKASLRAANRTRALILEEQLYQPGYGSLTSGYALRYLVMARFGMWEKALDEPQPPAKLLYPTAIWHYSRGLAHIRMDQTDSARSELEQLEGMAEDDKVSQMDAWGERTTGTALQIAVNTLTGEIAAAEGELERAESLLREAVELEDNLGYYEPPVWFTPSRLVLGAILLEAGKPEAAEAVYRQNLENFPDNGWGLYGLYRSLIAQGEDSEARDVKSAFDEAWSRADVELSASRL